LARLDALVIGREEADAYEPVTGDLIKATREETFENRRFQSTMDELYWCPAPAAGVRGLATSRRLDQGQARRFGPGIKERFEFGATVDRNTVHARKCAASPSAPKLLEMLGKRETAGFLVLPTVPGAAPLKSARATGDAGLSRAGA